MTYYDKDVNINNKRQPSIGLCHYKDSDHCKKKNP